MAKVHAQIVVDLELDELTLSGTRLDLNGLSSATKLFLEGLQVRGPKLRVLEVTSPTKDWQIEGQLRLKEPF